MRSLRLLWRRRRRINIEHEGGLILSWDQMTLNPRKMSRIRSEGISLLMNETNGRRPVKDEDEDYVP